MKENKNILICLLKTGTAEPERTSVVRQWLCKNVPTATKPNGLPNGHERNNRGTVESGVFYAVHVEARSNTSTVSLRVVGGDEKGTQCLGV
jgi:hypothetical protein